jgi:hypothetical protein
MDNYNTMLMLDIHHNIRIVGYVLTLTGMGTEYCTGGSSSCEKGIGRYS